MEENLEWKTKAENLLKEKKLQTSSETRPSSDIYFQYIQERMEMQKEIDSLKNKLAEKNGEVSFIKKVRKKSIISLKIYLKIFQ
jgi:hypothetical protein